MGSKIQKIDIRTPKPAVLHAETSIPSGCGRNKIIINNIIPEINDIFFIFEY
jgi:hypothetical protein